MSSVWEDSEEEQRERQGLSGARGSRSLGGETHHRRAGRQNGSAVLLAVQNAVEYPNELSGEDNLGRLGGGVYSHSYDAS